MGACRSFYLALLIGASLSTGLLMVILLQDIVVRTLEAHARLHLRRLSVVSPPAPLLAVSSASRDRAFAWWLSTGAPCTPPRSSTGCGCRCASPAGGSANGPRSACRHRMDGAVSQALARGPLARPQARYQASRHRGSAPMLSSSRGNALTLAGVQCVFPALQHACSGDVAMPVMRLLRPVRRRWLGCCPAPAPRMPSQAARDVSGPFSWRAESPALTTRRHRRCSRCRRSTSRA